jgi:hypothetical protein
MTKTLLFVLIAATLATASAQTNQYSGPPLPADLQVLDSIPEDATSFNSLQHWWNPPHPFFWLSNYAIAFPETPITLYWSPSQVLAGVNRVYVNDLAVDYELWGAIMEAVRADLRAMTMNAPGFPPDADPPSTNGYADPMVGVSSPDYSTNTTDLWLSITNLGSSCGVPNVTTSTIVFHNTHPGLYYRLLASTNLSDALCTWSTYQNYDGLLDQGGTITLTNVVWTNAPQPGLWTNTYGAALFYYPTGAATWASTNDQMTLSNRHWYLFPYNQ